MGAKYSGKGLQKGGKGLGQEGWVKGDGPMRME